MSSSRGVWKPRRVLTLALLTLAAGACDSPTDDENGLATMSVFLTDAPGDVDSVWVQIEDVYLQGDGGRVSLLEEPTELINVTALAESTETLVDGVEIDAGDYSEVRFVIGGAVLQTETDVYTFGGAEHPGGEPATGDLQCPSCAQSGLKVKITDGLTVEEGATGLLLDFDVSQSFGHVAGQSGKWVMHPVILGAVVEPAVVAGGDGAPASIAGTVVLGSGVTVPACGGAERTLTAFVPTATSTVVTDDQGNKLVFSGATTATDAGFTFTIGVLQFDAYTLGHAAETTFTSEKLVWTATVEPTTTTVTAEAAQATGVVYTVTGATCQPLS